jgi:hypothetical protein
VNVSPGNDVVTTFTACPAVRVVAVAICRGLKPTVTAELLVYATPPAVWFAISTVFGNTVEAVGVIDAAPAAQTADPRTLPFSVYRVTVSLVIHVLIATVVVPTAVTGWVMAGAAGAVTLLTASNASTYGPLIARLPGRFH